MDYDASCWPLKSVLPAFSTIRAFLPIHRRTGEIKDQLLFEGMCDARLPPTESLCVLTIWTPSTWHPLRPLRPIPPLPAFILVLPLLGCPHGLGRRLINTGTAPRPFSVMANFVTCGAERDKQHDLIFDLGPRACTKRTSIGVRTTPIRVMVVDGFRPIFRTVHARGADHFSHEIHLALLVATV